MFRFRGQKLEQQLTSQLYAQNVELAVSNKTLSLLRRLDDIMLAGLDLSSLAKEVSDALVETFNFPLVGVTLSASLDDPLEWLHLACVGEAAEICSLDFSGDKRWVASNKKTHPYKQAIETKKMTVVSEPRELFTQIFLDQLTQKTVVLKECVLLPLLLGQGAAGVLVVGLPRQHDELTRVEQEALQNIGQAVTIGVQQALLHEQLMDTSEALREANGQLRHLDQSKDEFLSIVSQQLRTPLSAIAGYAKVIQGAGWSKLNAKQKEVVKKVSSGADGLVILVEQLLKVSQFEHRVAVPIAPLDLVRLCQETVDFLSVKAKEHRLKLSCQKEKMPKVLGNAANIKQVLISLLENAMSYTPSGSVVVRLFDELEFVRVEIRDTGWGLTVEDLDSLFQKFFRGAAAKASGQGGSGLGLYICKQLLEGMGGEIWAESQGLKQGSIFIFRLKKAPVLGKN